MESQGNAVKNASGRPQGRPTRSRACQAMRWVVWGLLLLMLGVAHATSYVYDANGRVVAVTQNSGVSATYTYDTVGNLVRM